MRVDEIERFDLMLDVAIFNEKNNAFKMTFDVNMKTIMIKNFDYVDSLTRFFAKDSIVLITCFLIDSNMIKLIIRFFLIHVTNETR